MRNWSVYYEHAGPDPRDTLLDALERFDAPGRAVDLGCGAGRDTFELLRRGWGVLAIDGEQEAIDRLVAAAPPGELETRVARLEQARWPEVDLVNSSFTLPFCAPGDFPDLWRRIVESVRPGGRFCGQLFGDRDGWAGNLAMTFHDADAVRALFAGFALERLDEEDEEGRIVTGEPKHWHVFHVVARKVA